MTAPTYLSNAEIRYSHEQLTLHPQGSVPWVFWRAVCLGQESIRNPLACDSDWMARVLKTSLAEHKEFSK